MNGAMDLVIKGGQVVRPDGVRKLAIGVKDGKIAALAADESVLCALRIVDASGKYILPGIVDPECHAGSARPLKDSLDSETKAAAAGGVTTWGIMQASPKLRKTYIDEPELKDVVP